MLAKVVSVQKPTKPKVGNSFDASPAQPLLKQPKACWCTHPLSRVAMNFVESAFSLSIGHRIMVHKTHIPPARIMESTLSLLSYPKELRIASEVFENKNTNDRWQSLRCLETFLNLFQQLL